MEPRDPSKVEAPSPAIARPPSAHSSPGDGVGAPAGETSHADCEEAVKSPGQIAGADRDASGSAAVGGDVRVERPSTECASPVVGVVALVSVEPVAPEHIVREPSGWYSTKPEFPPPPGCRRVRVPLRGWLDVDDDVRRRVDGIFNIPMLVLALLVLPLLALEYYVGQEGVHHPVLKIALTAAAGFIWFAFLIEFVIKISIASSRLQYALKNWIDIVIIMLPMLRVLRGMQALRSARMLRAAQSAKTLRALQLYQLRGVAMKLMRTAAGVVVGLEFVARLRSRYRKAIPQQVQPDYTHWPRSALIAEIGRLNSELERLKPVDPSSGSARTLDESLPDRHGAA